VIAKRGKAKSEEKLAAAGLGLAAPVNADVTFLVNYTGYSAFEDAASLEYPQSIVPLNAMVLFCIPSKNKPATMVKRESL
jgi:hypothetical protein